MSISYDIGFTKKPELAELDAFMQLLGFEIEPSENRKGKFTQVYVLCNESVPREIEFLYENNADDYTDFFGAMGNRIRAYGCLKTFETGLARPNLEERLRIIEENKVKTEQEWYKFVAPERLKFYETALALRKHYHAIVRSEQTGKEINPDRLFPEKQK
ncbi:MAG: hypothetical protein AABY26_05845 [Nanoarchaeota archaeon]|mgnify:CR=1 FL=1